MGPAAARFLLLTTGLLLTGCPVADDDDTTPPEGDDDDTTAGDDDDDDTTAETVSQDPVTVTLANATADRLYFPYVEWWSEGLNDLLTCAVQDGEAWGSCLAGLPYGVAECSEANRGQHCPGEPDGGSAVLILEAGESGEVVWPGTLWSIDPEHCLEGVCAREGDPTVGRYQFSATAWPAMGCFHGECPPDKAGIVWEAYVTGDARSVHVEFDVPHAGEPLELTFP